MTRFVTRRTGVVLAVALLAGLAVSTGQSAQAYPPGTKLSLAANRATVPVTQKVTLTAYHVGPGCSVSFTFGKQHATSGSHLGTAHVTFLSTATHGTILASASTFGCAYHEHAFTSVKASTPGIVLPTHAVKNHSFTITVLGFPALRNVKIRIYNSHFSKTITVTTASGGTSSPTFTLPRSGPYVVVASSGPPFGAYASGVLYVYSH